MSFVVLSHSLYHVPTTFFPHRHALTVDNTSQTEKYVAEFPHLQCKQLHHVSHFNPARIVPTGFFLCLNV